MAATGQQASVRAGQGIRASDVNAHVATLNDLEYRSRQQLPGGLSGAPVAQYLSMLAVNVDSAPVSPGQVLVIKGAVASSIVARESYLRVGVAGSDDDLTKLVVVVKAGIAPGCVGLVAVSGLAWALLSGSAASYAQLTAGAAYLTGAASGSARVLTTMTEGSLTYALVQFPCTAQSVAAGGGTFYLGWYDNGA